ncbi:endodeoxyribonuclease [Dispira parvispora]|uniref:Endodeoxyribonuclease n=1 Tax=Dispira parvispora TaxID=1520584 RepID=A0A9W8E4Z5_9FUNG|nr:endodeoxyribonuclease [Dispira parvispora]
MARLFTFHLYPSKESYLVSVLQELTVGGSGVDLGAEICEQVSIPKGMAYGALQHTRHGLLVRDYSSSDVQSDRLYWPIYEVGPEDVLHCAVQFILLVEKEATFHHLVASRFCDRHGPCLVVTGRGYPDVCTREFLHRLMNVTKPRGVPIVALTDGDPHGIEILCTYKFGSKALGFDSAQLAIPTLRWLGIHRYDIDRLVQDVICYTSKT